MDLNSRQLGEKYVKWFQSFKSKSEQDKESDVATDITHIARPSSPEPRKGFLARLGWRSKRAEQLEVLQTGYQQLLGLMESIRNHLEEQSNNQESMLSQMPDVMEGLKSVGKAAEQHTEVIQLVKQQFESSVEHDRKLVESMDSFNKTLELMDTTSRNSSGMVQRMGVRAVASENMLHAALERSEKRMMGMVLILVIALLGLGGALIYVVRPDLFGEHFAADGVMPSAIVQEQSKPVVPPEDIPVVSKKPASAQEVAPTVEKVAPASVANETSSARKTKKNFYFYKQ